MTNNDLNVVIAAVKASLQKTPVKVYDNNGDEITFFKEDVVNVIGDKDKKTITRIILAAGCCARYLNNEMKVVDMSKINVFGTEQQWKKLLDFNVTCLNEPEED